MVVDIAAAVTVAHIAQAAVAAADIAVPIQAAQARIVRAVMVVHTALAVDEMTR